MSALWRYSAYVGSFSTSWALVVVAKHIRGTKDLKRSKISAPKDQVIVYLPQVVLTRPQLRPLPRKLSRSHPLRPLNRTTKHECIYYYHKKILHLAALVAHEMTSQLGSSHPREYQVGYEGNTATKRSSQRKPRTAVLAKTVDKSANMIHSNP